MIIFEDYPICRWSPDKPWSRNFMKMIILVDASYGFHSLFIEIVWILDSEWGFVFLCPWRITEKNHLHISLVPDTSAWLYRDEVSLRNTDKFIVEMIDSISLDNIVVERTSIMEELWLMSKLRLDIDEFCLFELYRILKKIDSLFREVPCVSDGEFFISHKNKKAHK